MWAPGELGQRKRKTIRLSLPAVSDGLANKDRKKNCAWQVMSIKGQSFLTNLSSNRNNKKGERQEEKSRERETWRLASVVTASALLAVFRSGDRYHQLKQQRNKSLETEDTIALLPWGTTSHLCLVFVAHWDLGQGTPPWVEWGQAAASAQQPPEALMCPAGQATGTNAPSWPWSPSDASKPLLCGLYLHPQHSP